MSTNPSLPADDAIPPDHRPPNTQPPSEAPAQPIPDEQEDE